MKRRCSFVSGTRCGEPPPRLRWAPVTTGSELLIDASPRPMFVSDRATLAIVAVNAAACRLYGRTREELLAMTIRDLRKPDELSTLDRALERERTHTKQIYTRLSRHITKDGRSFDVDVEMSRIQLTGRPCVLCLIVDLTETETSLRHALANFRALIERLPTGPLVHRGALVIYINPAGVRTLRYDAAAQVLGT